MRFFGLTHNPNMELDGDDRTPLHHIDSVIGQPVEGLDEQQKDELQHE